MFLQLITATLAGASLGIITGLIPGIHVNLISIILLSLSSLLLNLASPLTIATVIISMAVTHSFLDSIPSIYLGAPDSDMSVSVLPGHKMLLEGKGHQAVLLTVIGSLLALILSIIISPLLFVAIKNLYPFLNNIIAYLLIIIVLYMLLKDKNRLFNIFIFLTSGILGLIVLNIFSLKSPLFPLLSGLFGTSTLILSLTQNSSLPLQSIKQEVDINKTTITKAITGSTLAGSLTSLFPGLGPAQGAVLATQIVRNIGDKGFLILVGGINTVNFVMSLLTLHLLSKTRNGAVVVVKQLVEILNINKLVLLITVALITGGLATLLAINISKIFSKLITKVNYRTLCISIIILIAGTVTAISGIEGILVLIIATAVGLLAPLLNVARNHSMGCLLLPVILFLV
ncbi:hypothetical protein HN419_01010 [Candidatus Woesearchaeota archaeon]|jgi:putative membrane protein|nr:hypothetical protein [Candidatus Woesearchaeota archaeon]MBT7929453.1 hypothetical protein [Candidatus Peregrinibacteria bacterium]MBT3537423.1 hypothetical protein [Candidatus Woesearchaeota archaeon]MBT4697776.1 hypothetical protein [Candidatus Woesearchaeota archaeon]MBT4717537.1 hypothetical protein [Candidatus Woesearchaeota archaeon]